MLKKYEMLCLKCLSLRNPPVVFSCGDQTRHVSKDPSAALDDGERVGLASVRQCADQEAQSSVHRTDRHLVVDAVSRQIP